MAISEASLAAVRDRQSLFALLRDELQWPVDPEDTFTYDAQLPSGNRAEAAVSQIVPFGAGDPYLIMLVEFHSGFRRTDLREVLRGIRGRMRAEGAYQGRDLEDILFVCATGGYHGVRLSRFETRNGRQPKLSVFGWDRDQVAETRTLRELNLPALRMPGANVLGEPDWERANWAAAWDAESVTTEFFREYRRVFEHVEEAIGGIRGDRRLFTQRLFNRLMFIRFLEKKGWLRFNGSRTYLMALREAARAGSENFYEQRLYHAFFHGLGVIQDDRRLHDLKFWIARRGEVPFLNGGLFEMEEDDQFGRAQIPNEALDLVLDDLFARFNFTITESTPDDVEVAVDPEMLGKVFEELVTGRHETGSYYTPRPVVQFMCREALKGFLNSAEPALVPPEVVARLVDDHDAGGITIPQAKALLQRLANVKAVDPACGSGAYLLGMLHELHALTRLLDTLAEQASSRDDYHRRLAIIQHNLYGVDIDEFAVNIARLRLWLSLAVEFEGDTPEPLPNLDFKIECSDSLAAPAPGSAAQTNAVRELVAQFAARKADYASPYHQADKAALKREIEALREDIRSWQRTSASEGAFDWWVEFAEVFIGPQQPSTSQAAKQESNPAAESARTGGFDIVLANPPYVRQERISAQKPALQRAFPQVYTGTADLYCYFYARAIELLGNGGMLVFISSNKWLRAGYGAKLRAHLAAATAVQSITDFGELPVFQSAATFPMIFIAQKAEAEHQSSVFTQVKSLDAPYPNVRAVIQQYGHPLPAGAFNGDRWTLAGSAAAERLRRMEAAGQPLGEYVGGQFYWGVKTGFNAAFYISSSKRRELISSDSKSAEIIKPLAVGDDVRRWRIDDRDRWLIYSPWDLDIDAYPAIKQHLMQWRTDLRARPECAAGRYNWWCLARYGAQFVHHFSAPKIVYPEIAKEPRFAFDTTGAFTNNKAYIIASADRYLLGVLNSSVAWEYLKALCSILGDQDKGGRLELRSTFMEKLPIPLASPEDRVTIAALAQKCLDAQGVGCEEWEQEINRRVEFLYFHRQGDEIYEEWQARIAGEAAGEVGALRALLEAGEGQTTEFKGSVLWDLRQDKYNTTMRDEVLKEICAFLNADGGTLLCGVDDAGKVTGLRKDLKHAGNYDRLGRMITDGLGDLLKPHPVELVRLRWVEIDGETVLRIDVTADPTERYESQFDKRMRTFVRVEGSAKALEGQDLLNWWDRRRRLASATPPHSEH